MRNFVFEKNFPSLSYIVNNWPKTKPILKKYIISNSKKPDLLKLCISCLKDLNIRCYSKKLGVLKKISFICSKNVYCNTYHDPHHFKSVIILSCLLAKMINLKMNDRFLLVIIALAHDMNHQGRRIVSKPFYQENRSVDDLKKIIFPKILNQKKWLRIKRVFQSTYFPIKPKYVEDDLEKIILDADILASLMFGVDTGIKFASRLKHEIRFEMDSKKLFMGFLNLLNQKSLYLDSSKKLC